MFPLRRLIASALFFLLAAVPARAAELIGFEDGDFRGPSARFNSPVPDLRATGSARAMSSVRVRSGQWTLCSQPHFQGNCVVTGQDIRRLSQLGFNDRVASLRPVAGGPPPPGNGGWGPGARPPQGTIVLFTDANFRGEALRLDHTVPDLDGSGLNNRIGSFRVFGGVWQLCTSVQFAGQCVTANTNVHDLSVTMNDRVASIRRVQ